jgi:hypothetical protein
LLAVSKSTNISIVQAIKFIWSVIEAILDISLDLACLINSASASACFLAKAKSISV